MNIFLSNILRFALGVQKNRLIYCINKQKINKNKLRQFFEYMCTVESGTLAFIKDNKITYYQECGPIWCEL